MASINKDKNGKWQARVSYKDSNGKFRTKSNRFSTKHEAQLFSNQYEIKADKGGLNHKQNIKFTDYFYEWYQDYKVSKLAPATKNRYEITYKELESFFGETTMGELNQRLYQRFINQYGAHHAKQTVKKVNNIVHACIKNAMYEDIISKDFISRVELVYDKSRDRKIEYLNVKELKRLTIDMLNNLNPHFTSRYMILTAIYTGMRIGEIQGLQWQDINYNFKTISVKRAWNEIAQEVKPTKNESSIRVIRVSDELLTVLKQLENATNPQSKKSQIFINQYGTVPTSAACNKTLRKTLKDLEIDKQGFHFHSLRHTHVAFLLSSGIDLYVISKRLGHSDLSTTTKIYAYMIDEFRVRTDKQIALSLDKLTEKNSLNVSNA